MPHIKTGNANTFIEEQLDARLSDLADKLQADVLTLNVGMLFGVDDIVRDAIEAQKAASAMGTNGLIPSRDRLAVVLTTMGGYIEVVQRIVATMRKHYTVVDFYVPNYAYSAGTVLCMAGDSIWMDYYSRLGPIDPQVPNREGRMVPALGYLTQYYRLLKKAKNGKISDAEVQILLGTFDQAELYQYEQARKLSVRLLKEWLAKYKFKNWTTTRERGLPVTPQMREQRAEQIGEQLNDTGRWHTHGHGISMEVLDKELNLIIDDFADDDALNTMIKRYFGLLDDYMQKNGTPGVVHMFGDYTPIYA